MNGLIKAAVTRWQITALFTALLVALGVGAFGAIPRTEDPLTNSPVFQITAVVPGASPDDMEQQVAKPIEEALGGIDDLRDLNSWSSDDAASIRAEFDWGADPERRYDEVVRELNALRPKLPAGLSRLEVVRGRTSAVPIVQVALTSDLLPADRLEKLARRLKDRLARVPGIRKAEVFGAGQAGNARVGGFRAAGGTARSRHGGDRCPARGRGGKSGSARSMPVSGGWWCARMGPLPMPRGSGPCRSPGATARWYGSAMWPGSNGPNVRTTTGCASTAGVPRW